MADTENTTGTHEAEGFSVTLTEDNFPRCLKAQDAAVALDSCGDIAAFLREAVASMLMNSREQGLPVGEDLERIVLGYEKCYDLLLDHLDLAAGTSPLPLVKDMEARRNV